MSIPTADPKTQATTPKKASPLDAFKGELPRNRTSLMYRLGLVVVALVMVLLPMVYVCLIMMVAYVVYLHVITDWRVFGLLAHVSGIMPVLLTLVLYFGPIFVGGVLIVFMIKPLFAPKKASPIMHSVDPRNEPLLFAFVKRLTTIIGAPMPTRIDFDCQVNASASFRKGWISVFQTRGDMVLTIGTPLVSGLTLEEFTGVLAHEFGHFSQGGGMRLTYIIRSINGWFARVVYERDAWDQWVAQTTRSSQHWTSSLIMLAVNWSIFVTRLILMMLMKIGHGVSCFALRQMEYDADRYSAGVVGADVFESTSYAMARLSAASNAAIGDLNESFNEGRLGDDMSVLVVDHQRRLPAKVKDAIDKGIKEAKTGIFDTHPCDPDRFASVRAAGYKPIFTSDLPTMSLFSNFSKLSRDSTLAFYAIAVGKKMADVKLVSSNELLAKGEKLRDAGDASARFFQRTISLNYPTLIAVEPITPAKAVDPVAESIALRARMVEQAKRMREAVRKAEELNALTAELTAAQAIVDAELKYQAANPKLKDVKPNRFRGLRQQYQTDMNAQISELTAIGPVHRERLGLILQLTSPGNPLVVQHPDLVPLYGRLVTLFANLLALQRLQTDVARIQTALLVSAGLFAKFKNHSKSQPLIREIVSQSDAVRDTIIGVRSRASDMDYPFEHGKEALSHKNFLVRACPPASSRDVSGILNAGAQLAETYSTLCQRILGEIASIGEQVEERAGLAKLDAPPEEAGTPA